MTVDVTFLAQIHLFAQLDDEERAVLAQSMHERVATAGEVLFQIGDAGDSMFIVKEGAVELFVKDTAGQKILLHTARTSDFFGELSLLDGGSRTASATCIESTTLLILDREDLLELFRKRPHAALDMLAVMGRMTRKANALLRERVVKNANDEMHAEDKDNVVIRIADWVAAFSGSITFLVLHIILFTLYMSFNSIFESIAFDPFPFNFLTMTVSLEAIILATLLLFSGNRSAARDKIRNDIEYEINLKAELEVAHLHEKTDRMYEEMVDRFSRLEKGLNLGRPSGPHKTLSASDPALPRSNG